MTQFATMADAGYLGDWKTKIPLEMPIAAVQQMLFLMEKATGRRFFCHLTTYDGQWHFTSVPTDPASEDSSLVEQAPALLAEYAAMDPSRVITAAETRPRNSEWPWN